MPRWKPLVATECPEKGSSLLWITCVYPPLSEHLLPQEQSCCCCEQTKLMLDFWPEDTRFRRKVWPRAETRAVADTFIHLQTENTPHFPNSLYHGKIALEALKWIKSNFLPLPVDWCWCARCSNFPIVVFWGLEINFFPPPFNSPSFPNIHTRVKCNLNLHHIFFLPLVKGFQVTFSAKVARRLYLKFLLVSQVCFLLA